MAKEDKTTEEKAEAAQATADKAAAKLADELKEAADKEAADEAAEIKSAAKKLMEADPETLTKGQQYQAASLRKGLVRAEEAAVRTKELNEKLKAAGKDSFRVTCTPKCTGGMTVPNLGIRIPAAGVGDVVVPGPLKDGSWLQAQISAGLVVVVD